MRVKHISTGVALALVACVVMLAIPRFSANRMREKQATAVPVPAFQAAVKPAAQERSGQTSPAFGRTQEEAVEATPPADAHSNGQHLQWTPAMHQEMARLLSPSVPIRQRLQEMEAMGRRGDENALALLRAIADQNTYLNYAAVEALGLSGHAGLADYLTAKLAHPDSRMVCAAIKSLASIAGEQAIPLIGTTLEANRMRDDGHHDVVCTACVEALEALAVPAAVPLLEAELEQAVASLGHEYASAVVRALAKIEDQRVAPALRTYKDALERTQATMTDNPMGRDYLQGKIEEVQAVLTAPPLTPEAGGDTGQQH